MTSDFNKLASDPFSQQKLEKLQTKYATQIAKLMDEMTGVLSKYNKAPESSLSRQPTSVLALASGARQREMAGKQSRSMAQALVIGAIINAENPNWDPTDPSTHQEGANNVLMSLLQAEFRQ